MQTQLAASGGDWTVREGEIGQHEAGASSEAAPAAAAHTSGRPGDSTDLGCVPVPTCLASLADTFWLQQSGQTVMSGPRCSSQSRGTARRRLQQCLLSAMPAMLLPAKMLDVLSSSQNSQLQHGAQSLWAAAVFVQPGASPQALTCCWTQSLPGTCIKSIQNRAVRVLPPSH